MRNFDYVNAPTTARALELLSTASPDRAARPRAVAGGTDLLDLMKEGIVAPARLVNLKANRALGGIRFDAGSGLELGALATLAAVEEHEAVRRHYPILAAAVGTIASPQIRNVATVGGNLCQRPRCWYFREDALVCTRKGGPVCYAIEGENQYHAILGGHLCFIVHPSDLAPALVACDARITYVGPSGPRTLPLADFFIGPEVNITRENVLGPTDVVERVTVPPPAAGARGVYLKARERQTWDFAIVSVAAVLEMAGAVCQRARLVLGAVAPKPWRVPAAEKLLTGERITPALAGQAADAALEGALPLSQNAYKVTLAKNLVRRAILGAAGLSA